MNKVVWIGRFTGPKGELARLLLREVVPRFPAVTFTFVGGPRDSGLEAGAPANACFTGFVADVAAIVREHDLVIGGGRVPPEAMRLGRPVIAMGESCYIGPVTAASIARAKATNFGDCAPPERLDPQRIAHDLEAVLGGACALPVDEYPSFLEEYEPESVYSRVMQVYRQAAVDACLEGFPELPVLAYHRVVSEPPLDSRFNVYITRADLDRQLGLLRRRGYETVTFRDIAGGHRARRPVILTFDDGYADNHENLLPLLERHDAKAVVFVLGDRRIGNNAWDMALGDPEVRLMSDAQVRACHASGRIEIGSHGLRHRHLPELDATELVREVGESKRALESLLGSEVLSFAYPYGDYGDREVEAVRDAGYLFGIGTVTGPVRIGADRYRIRRIPIFPGTSRFAFWKKTSGFYLRYCRLKGKNFR